MVGISKNLATRDDWFNTYRYVISQSYQNEKDELRYRLLALRNSGKMLVLKKGVNKPAEEQTPEDYEEKTDPGSLLVKSGLTVSEIDEMVSKLSGKE
jgi:hypothetical protein